MTQFEPREFRPARPRKVNALTWPCQLFSVQSAPVRALLRRSNTLLRLYGFATEVWQHETNSYLSAKRAQFIKEEGPIVRLALNGLQHELDLRVNHDYLVYQEMTRHSYYERATSRFFIDTLTRGDVFLDIGANSGYFTILASSVVGAEGRVLSFEPNPVSRRRLCRNVELNRLNNVVVHDFALSDRDGITTLFVDPLDDGLSSIRPRFPSQPELVRTFRLDSLGIPRVDWMKIDAEGSELPILRGMPSLLKSNPRLRVVLEWNWKYGTSEVLRELLSRFVALRIDDDKSRGYRLNRITSDSQLPGLCNLLLLNRGESNGVNLGERELHRYGTRR